MNIISLLPWEPKNKKKTEYSPTENNVIKITHEKLFLQKPGYLSLVVRLTRDKYQIENKVNTTHLTHYSPVLISIPLGFLMFLGGVEKQHGAVMG